MKNFLFIIFLLPIIFYGSEKCAAENDLSASAGGESQNAPSAAVLPREQRRAGYRIDFSDIGGFSSRWQFYGTPMVKQARFYLATVGDAEDGRVVVLETDSSSGLLLHAPGIDYNEFPIIHWRWRVVNPIKGSNAKPEPDDQSGAVYIGDGSKWRQYCVCYRWETATALGTQRSLRYRAGLLSAKTFCVRNSETDCGEWVEEYRDYASDFKKAYKRPLGTPFVIALGANSQYTKSKTRVEIDYIEFLPRSEMPQKQ
jgi:hypothetical protein